MRKKLKIAAWVLFLLSGAFNLLAWGGLGLNREFGPRVLDAIPIHAPHLLKALVRQDATTSRCQLRGGVHLEGGYVNDVCLSPRFNQCVFYEDELTRE